MQENDKKPNWGNRIVAGIVCTIIAISAILVISPQIMPNHDVQVSELPIEKLNQGYDIICKTRGTSELCLLNQTARVTIGTDITLHLQDNQGNHKTVNLFEINATNAKYCVKQWISNWNNTANTECDHTVAFDKKVWTPSIIPSPNGKENIIAFRHNELGLT